MSSDMENTVIKLFIDAMELSGVSSPNKISNGKGHQTFQTIKHLKNIYNLTLSFRKINILKVDDPFKVLAIGLTETYSHMAPWHVIMGQSFGASITYQLDAGRSLYQKFHKTCRFES